MPESFFVMRRVPITKIVSENAACCWRSRLFVVEPHSISTVPFCTSGMRFCEVTGMNLTFRLGMFSFCLTASTTFIWNSYE
jgi:hypothetical protein